MDTTREIRRGDVVLVPFPYVTDFRKAKTRPALVVQNDIGNRFGSTVIVALISSSVPEKWYPMHYKRAILQRLGSLPTDAIRQADEALAFSLDLRLASPARQ